MGWRQEYEDCAWSWASVGPYTSPRSPKTRTTTLNRRPGYGLLIAKYGGSHEVQETPPVLILPIFRDDRPRGREAKNQKNWRRGRDSNPRWTKAHSGFQDRCIKPLCHLSNCLQFDLNAACRRSAVGVACDPFDVQDNDFLCDGKRRLIFLRAFPGANAAFSSDTANPCLRPVPWRERRVRP